MDRSECPSVERLDRFLGGDLPAGEWDWLSSHLDDCGRCQGRVEQLLTNDSVLTWLRTTAARAEPGPPDEFLNSMRRLVPLVATSSITLTRPDGAPEPDVAPRPGPEPCPEQIGGYEIL